MKITRLLPLTLVIAVCGMASCSKQERKPQSFNGQDSSTKNIALVMGNPIDYGQDTLLLFPVGGNYNPQISKSEKEDEKDNDMYSKSGATSNDNGRNFMRLNETSIQYDKRAGAEYMNNDEETFDIRNLLFYDQKSGSSYLLSFQNMHILSFSIHREYKRPLIFYRVVKKDINGDGKYNSKDAVMFSVSDINGKNMVDVTPEDEQYMEYFYYPVTNTILIKSAFDIDKNGKFNAFDETNFREMKLDTPARGREIFTKSLKDSIKQILK